MQEGLLRRILPTVPSLLETLGAKDIVSSSSNESLSLWLDKMLTMMSIVAFFAASLFAIRKLLLSITTKISPASSMQQSGRSKFQAAPLVEASIAKNARILVTGGTGYVSGWIIKLALDAGYKVRTTVRKVGPAQDYLRRLAQNDGDLEIVECELMSGQEEWDKAVKGCEGICHVASPMDFGAADPLNDLVIPQLNGTECILRAAKRFGVKRVVVTSSSQTISSTTPDWKVKVYDENDWNTEASLTRFAYPYSKLLQEQLVFKFSREQGVSVVTMVPYSICGPALPGSPCNTPQEKLVASVLRGEVFCGIDFSVGIVDVRDVALAHLRALQVPKACGRYILWSDVLPYPEMYRLLREMRPDMAHNIPNFTLPRFLDFFILGFVRLKFGLGVMQIVQAGFGKFPRFDVSRTEKDLGIQFRSPREILSCSITALEEWKCIPPPPLKKQ